MKQQVKTFDYFCIWEGENGLPIQGVKKDYGELHPDNPFTRLMLFQEGALPEDEMFRVGTELQQQIVQLSRLKPRTRRE